MRHRRKGRGLSRSRSHRKAVLRNLAIAVIEHRTITTTLAKAKEVRGLVDRLVQYSKKGDLAARRRALRVLPNKKAVGILFHEIAPVMQDREGGYTRIIKLGQRRGDAAELAILELVGFEGTLIKRQEKAKSEREKRKEREKKEREEAEAAAQAEAAAAE
ncbi:MAG: 50S ribosomal protein L17 [Calditrichaeota bacterium]|nr:50S ribosomal protein L17 [Calditrichota bacterium]